MTKKTDKINSHRITKLDSFTFICQSGSSDTSYTITHQPLTCTCPHRGATPCTHMIASLIYKQFDRPDNPFTTYFIEVQPHPDFESIRLSKNQYLVFS